MERIFLKNKFLTDFINFVLFGNIYIALAAVCLVQSTCIQLQLTSRLPEYSILVFFATLFIYNLQRVFYKPQKDTTLNSVRRTWIFKNLKTVKLLSFIGFIGVCIIFFLNDHRIVFYLTPLLVLSIAYFSPFIKLRESPLFKFSTLVIVWTTVTSLVPILLCNTTVSGNDILHVFTRFCFIMALCIPFDIRDQQIDNADHVFTLVQVMGEKNAKWLAFTFMMVYTTLIVFEDISGMLSIKVFAALIISALINSVFVVMSNSKRGEYFFVALIDGTMILQGVLLIAVEMLL